MTVKQARILKADLPTHTKINVHAVTRLPSGGPYTQIKYILEKDGEVGVGDFVTILGSSPYAYNQQNALVVGAGIDSGTGLPYFTINKATTDPYASGAYIFTDKKDEFLVRYRIKDDAGRTSAWSPFFKLTNTLITEDDVTFTDGGGSAE